MAGRLKGKVAFVTAAGQGIGRAIAASFAAEGAKVIATDLDEKKLSGLKVAKKVSLDVRSTKAVDALAKQIEREFGPIDILVNCAGFVHHGSVLECSEQDWDFSFDLNVKSMHRTIHAFVPGMLKKKRGSIVNIASGASSIRGIPNRYVYGASKAAVVGLTKAVAADYVQKGIRCNAIAPGTVDTPSLQDRINAFPDPVEARRMFIARQPMGRLAKPEELAPVVIFLASDESAFATGNVYSVDGGMTI